MVTNLPKPRELWIMLLVIILGGTAIVALKTGVAASGDVARGDRAEASASPAPSAVPSGPTGSTGPAQPPSLASLPADTRAQFDALPAGTVLVACSPAFVTYPEGVIPEVAGGWRMTHPGWRILLHGYCVDNPTAVRSFEPQVLETP
jgi:hypothetical protein